MKEQINKCTDKQDRVRENIVSSCAGAGRWSGHSGDSRLGRKLTSFSMPLYVSCPAQCQAHCKRSAWELWLISLTCVASPSTAVFTSIQEIQGTPVARGRDTAYTFWFLYHFESQQLISVLSIIQKKFSLLNFQSFLHFTKADCYQKVASGLRHTQSATVLFHSALNVNFNLWYLYLRAYVAVCQHQQKVKIKQRSSAHCNQECEGLER